MVAAAVTKNRKWPYLINGLTHHREIWHGDGYWHVDEYLRYRQLYIRPFQNPTWCTAIVLTIKKSRYVDKGLTDQDDLTVTHLNPN